MYAMQLLLLGSFPIIPCAYFLSRKLILVHILLSVLFCKGKMYVIKLLHKHVHLIFCLLGRFN